MCCGTTTIVRTKVDIPEAPEHVRGQVVCRFCCERTDMTDAEVEERIAENIRKALS